METPKTGYQVQSYSVPVKRYCQTLDLRDSPELIAEYRKRHSQAEAWPEMSKLPLTSTGTQQWHA